MADILAALGPSPTPDELSEVAGNRAKEKLDKYLSDASGAGICSVKFNALPEYSKSDVIMGTHLGKGSFSDAFEVTLKMKEDKPRATAESLNNDAEDLEAIFANLETKFSGPVAAPVSHARTSSDINGGRQRRPARRNSALSASVCVGSLSSQAPAARRPGDRTLTLAMKCLRPQIRSNPEQFLIGVEDLVHETAMLASLDHLHIIKLHGRASGNLTNAFKLGDGYFILLDRLKDTLDDRLGRWKKNYPGGKHPPSLNQLKAATAIADALAYLHSCNIVFRDLKPANVGFDSTGVLKLFDFGFAIGVEPSSADGSNDHLLYDKCGTPRYMAPEVGLMKGYGINADVYSFGILLWEICALKKPFAKIKSAGEFHKAVFEKGERPKVGKKWPKNLQETATSCWSTNPKDRPTMANVKTMLTALVRETTNNGGDANLRKSSMFRRFTWDI